MLQSRSRFSSPHALAILAMVLTPTASLHGQATSNPNQIVGTIELTNTGQQVLAVLGPPPGSDGGFSSGSVGASSVGVSPQLNNSTSFVSSERLSTPYEITVEAGPIGDGIVYDVGVEMRLDRGGDRYRFVRSVSAPVESEADGAGDVVVDFAECAGLLDVRWQTTAGDPVTIDGGSIQAFREISPGANSFQFQADDLGLPLGVSQEYLAVRGDGSLYRVDVFYEVGSDPFLDRIRLFHQAFVPVDCAKSVVLESFIKPGQGCH